MALIPQISNGESGLSARQKINQALRTVETDSSLTGNGSTSSPLSVNVGTISESITPVEVISIAFADSPYTVVKTKPHTIIIADATGGEINIQLDASASWTGIVTVKNVGTSDVIVLPDGAETIDLGADWRIYESGAAGVMEAYDFANDGSNVYIVGSFVIGQAVT